MRDRVFMAVAIGAIAVVAGSGVTVASARTGSSAQRAVHVVQFNGSGGLGADCDAGGCSSSGRAMAIFHVPAGRSRYEGVVTMSFEYRTSTAVPGGLGVDVQSTVRGTPDPRVHPSEIRLAASTQPTSTSVSFRVTGLRPGGSYVVHASADFSGSVSAGGSSSRFGSIGFRRFVTTVQAWPTS
jgi:hypothetical protein